MVLEVWMFVDAEILMFWHVRRSAYCETADMTHMVAMAIERLTAPSLRMLSVAINHILCILQSNCILELERVRL